ncbi:putative transposase [Azospirillum lipoferum]|uniref:Transposase family protein n=1 Tax=Azospirillum lipoferum TaxID=193 RepID=A0A5A9GFF8_AZOLI|nr:MULTISPECIES: DDE-type integrase/transposase/recombinase [Azospirillum]KAA0593151.1 transposase family protein [Azospirillum lipoferum]MCP1613555.1 putative transposase [Azospirillum lipoferum]MDW5532319.1 DDE-type integrase/transposase/recombinase [Azospirillum sp. NL1]
MSAVPLRFQPGDSLTIRDGTGGTVLWLVVERKRGGYLLKPQDGCDPRTWSDDELDDAYGTRRLILYPCNLAGLPKSLTEVLDKTWEYWPEEIRQEAQRRLVYVTMAETLRSSHSTWLDAFKAAAEAVYSAYRDRWTAEDRELMAKRAGEARGRRRKSTWGSVELDASSPVRKPHPLTLRRWYQRWNQNGRDIRMLISQQHRRGKRRPGIPHVPGAADHYVLMKEAVEKHYLSMPRKRKTYAYRKYEDACRAVQLHPASYRTFRLFIERSYTDYEEYQRRYGRRAAYKKFGIFERTELPQRPLEEVELDHCLIDLIVTHPITGRPLGRPWLTALLDRVTRVILGVHLSFEVPSYASLQRALAHAFWKKDLSGIEGLEHDWPCHGIPEWIFTDNGRELRSDSLRLSEAMLDFGVVNLPVKSPWLKGAVERLFGSIGVQVFSHQEGTVLSRTKDFYNPVERARRSLFEISRILLKWIVDDYHITEHPALGVAPLEKWLQLTTLYPVRPVPSFDQIIRMTGELITRSIQNVGVHYEGLLYADKKVLEDLRARRGRLDKKWTLRIDPYDFGEIAILDDETGQWHVLPCTDQDISRHVSKYQHRVHKLMAKRNLAAGMPITVEHLRKAKAMAEESVRIRFEHETRTKTAARAARYDSNGETFTPLAGGSLTANHKPFSLATAVLPSPVSASVQTEMPAAPVPVPLPSLPTPPSPSSIHSDLEDEVERISELWFKNMR